MRNKGIGEVQEQDVKISFILFSGYDLMPYPVCVLETPPRNAVDVVVLFLIEIQSVRHCAE